MKINEKDRLVLTGILRDRDRLAGLDFGAGHLPHGRSRGAYRLLITDAKKGRVRMNLSSWIGHEPSGAETVFFHRLYKRLEASGFLKRHSGGGRRTTHLSLTRKGARVAGEFCTNSETSTLKVNR